MLCYIIYYYIAEKGGPPDSGPSTFSAPRLRSAEAGGGTALPYGGADH